MFNDMNAVLPQDTEKKPDYSRVENWDSEIDFRAVNFHFSYHLTF